MNMSNDRLCQSPDLILYRLKKNIEVEPTNAKNNANNITFLVRWGLYQIKKKIIKEAHKIIGALGIKIGTKNKVKNELSKFNEIPTKTNNITFFLRWRIAVNNF